MKQSLILASAAALMAAGCATAADDDRSAEEEARLTTELANYEQSGPPQSCVNLRDLRGNRSVGETAIIFDGTGSDLWVNRPPAGCPSLEFGRALQTRTTSTRLCRGDIATVFDPTSSITFGGCGLGDFTPYRRRSG